ncbi:MAG: efflux RND transporter periplasmic adaptor subunit [gamma proteobacterium symbiont of Ctena orbiculata]
MKLSVLIIGFLFMAHAIAAPPKKPGLVTVTEVVEQKMREEIPLSGTAEALQESQLSPRLSGVVKEVFVEEGKRVEAGERILSLDSVIAKLDVASARAGLDEAIARHREAVRQKNEYQSLRRNKAVAASQLASAVAEEEIAQASIAKQRAEVERLEELLSRHLLTAPFSGVIAEKNVETGQWVKAESGVVKLVALDRIRIRASIPQRFYPRIKPELKTRIRFDSLPGEEFTGTLASMVAAGTRNTRAFPLLLLLDNRENRIAPGMSARIFIELSGEQQPSIMLPRDAIVLKADGSRVVWRVTGSDEPFKVKQVSVVTGRTQDNLVEILDSSLNVGDRVVLLGNENLRPGQSVKIGKAD